MRTDDHLPSALTDAGHLSDDQLLEICYPLTNDRHLESCEACRSRYDWVARTLEEVRASAVEEADALFTSERLASQRDAILRRIERAPHLADVVAFPAQHARDRGTWRASAPSRRWVAAAAAAGLVAGLLVGRYADVQSHSAGVPLSRSATSAAAIRTAEPALRTAQPGDEQLLVEIEDAVTSRRVAELQALDALTSPELREISLDGSR